MVFLCVYIYLFWLFFIIPFILHVYINISYIWQYYTATKHFDTRERTKLCFCVPAGNRHNVNLIRSYLSDTIFTDRWTEPQGIVGENSMHDGIGGAHLANLLLRGSDSVKRRLKNRAISSDNFPAIIVLLIVFIVINVSLVHWQNMTLFVGNV